MRLLIADDEPYALKRLHALLAEAGAEIVSEHPDGVSVVEWLQANPGSVEALFLDIQMPGLSGMEVAAEVGDTYPIVFVTGHGEHAVQAFDLEATDFIKKPLQPEHVARVLDKVRRRALLNRYRHDMPLVTLKVERGLQERVPIVCIEYFRVEDREVFAKVYGEPAERLAISFRSRNEVVEAFPHETFHPEGKNLLVRAC